MPHWPRSGELLWIKDFTDASYYAEDTNLNGQLDTNEDDGAVHFPSDNHDGILEKGFGTVLTCHSACRNRDTAGTGRINITTTDAGALAGKLSLSMPHAKWIEERAKDKTLTGIADLLDKNTPKHKSRDDEKGDDPKPLDLETFRAIADRITITDDKLLTGRVNINTADREVLVALFAGNETAADDLIAFRDTRQTPMTSIADLFDIKSMTVELFKTIAASITVRSDVFFPARPRR